MHLYKKYSEELSSCESAFFQVVHEKLGESLLLYLVAGSIATRTVEPEWSDIDVVLVSNSCTPKVLQSIRKARSTWGEWPKLGISNYLPSEVTSSLVTAGSAIALSQVNAGLITPKIRNGISLEKFSEAHADKLCRRDLPNVLKRARRQLILWERCNERALYKEIRTLCKVAFMHRLSRGATYSEVREATLSALGVGESHYPTTNEILGQPKLFINRAEKYTYLLEQIENSEYFQSMRY